MHTVAVFAYNYTEYFDQLHALCIHFIMHVDNYLKLLGVEFSEIC